MDCLKHMTVSRHKLCEEMARGEDPRDNRNIATHYAQPMKNILVVFASLVILAAAGAGLRAQAGLDLFQKALAAERADGNLRLAIQLYERVVAGAGNDRGLAARALLRMAECHQKLGNAEAQSTYQRILREFGDQTDAAASARVRLATLQTQPSQPSQTVRSIWAEADVDAMGAPSLDGRFLSFTDWETGDLAIRDLIQGTNRRLTNTGGWEVSGDFAEYSVISPDGGQVAYAWFTDKGSRPEASCTCRYDLRVLSLRDAAARPRILQQSDQMIWIRPVAWSPDGARLFVIRQVTDQSSQIAAVSVRDGSLQVLKSLDWRYPRAVTASPDGRFLAYDRPAEGDELTRDIVVLAVDGSGEWFVVRSPAHDHLPVWTADGSHLLFVSDRSGSEAIWRLPIRDGRATAPPVLVVNGRTGMTPLGVTRGGAVLYWSGAAGQDVYVADVDGSLRAVAAAVPLERFPGRNRAPTWSPDGETLAFLSQRGSSDSPGSTALVLHSMQTGQDREVPMRVLVADRISWFPDGRSVLVSSPQDRRRLAYYKVDVSTGETTLLLTTDGNGIPVRRPEVSPDGRSIFYVDRDRLPAVETSRLMRFDIESQRKTELKRLTGSDQYFTSFGVSPDGTEVAYLRFDGPRRDSLLEVIPSAGGDARLVYRDVRGLGGERYSGVAWSTDRRYLLFVSPGEAPEATFGVWKVPVLGGTPEPTGIVKPGVVRFPSVHPKGGRIAFAAVAEGQRPEVWSVEHFIPAPVAVGR